MGFPRLLPESKKLKVLLVLLMATAVPFTLYGMLLAGHAYHAWRLSRMLNSLEGIRVGDSAAKVLPTIAWCTIERSQSEYICQVVNLPLQFDWLQRLTWNMPDNWAVMDRLDRIGLRGSYVKVAVGLDRQQVRSLSVNMIVVGRYESLGSKWAIAKQIPERLHDLSLNPDDQRTYMRWFHITSIPPGEGFGVYATPASTAKELRARHVNPGCLFSFKGCDGLCELLPEAVTVLKERRRSWGGCSDVPPSPCDLNNDECRNSFGR